MKSINATSHSTQRYFKAAWVIAIILFLKVFIKVMQLIRRQNKINGNREKCLLHFELAKSHKSSYQFCMRSFSFPIPILTPYPILVFFFGPQHNQELSFANAGFHVAMRFVKYLVQFCVLRNLYICRPDSPMRSPTWGTCPDSTTRCNCVLKPHQLPWLHV